MRSCSLGIRSKRPILCEIAADAPGECQTGGGGCPVGIRIPEGYRNRVEVVFGREAGPGESYSASSDATASGEVLAGVPVEGRRVSEVLADLEHRHQAAEFHMLVPGTAETVVVAAADVPGDWYVYRADPLSDGVIILDVGATPERPQPAPPAIPPSPVPAPG